MRGRVEERTDSEASAADAAIAQLLREHRSLIFGYILACVQDPNDADDIYQEVCVGLVRSFDRLRSHDDFPYFGIGIAKRQVAYHLRKAGRRESPDTEIVELLAATSIKEETVDRRSARDQALAQCIEKLSPDHREILLSRYSREFRGVEQLADVCGRTTSATYGILKRAREHLRRCIEKQLAALEWYD